VTDRGAAMHNAAFEEPLAVGAEPEQLPRCGQPCDDLVLQHGELAGAIVVAGGDEVGACGIVQLLRPARPAQPVGPVGEGRRGDLARSATGGLSLRRSSTRLAPGRPHSSPSHGNTRCGVSDDGRGASRAARSTATLVAICAITRTTSASRYGAGGTYAPATPTITVASVNPA
jgi:hypothetical protein